MNNIKKRKAKECKPVSKIIGLVLAIVGIGMIVLNNTTITGNIIGFKSQGTLNIIGIVIFIAGMFILTSSEQYEHKSPRELMNDADTILRGAGLGKFGMPIAKTASGRNEQYQQSRFEKNMTRVPTMGRSRKNR